jgi:hypothetical protein
VAFVRKLHPIHARERLMARGGYRRPEGSEVWSLHELPLSRQVLRVQDEHDGLWHLVLDGRGRPERLQVRLQHDGRRLESTLTFFEDEVLIWRRGAEPSSEAIALPPGSRLLWPPLAGRLRCLGLPPGGAETDPEQATAIMTALVRLGSSARGVLTLRPVKFTLLTTAMQQPAQGEASSQVRLMTPGLPMLVATRDAEGEAMRWHEEADGKQDVLLGERLADDGATAPTA